MPSGCHVFLVPPDTLASARSKRRAYHMALDEGVGIALVDHLVTGLGTDLRNRPSGHWCTQRQISPQNLRSIEAIGLAQEAPVGLD